MPSTGGCGSCELPEGLSHRARQSGPDAPSPDPTPPQGSSSGDGPPADTALWGSPWKSQQVPWKPGSHPIRALVLWHSGPAAPNPPTGSRAVQNKRKKVTFSGRLEPKSDPR